MYSTTSLISWLYTMPLHVNFRKHQKIKYGRTDYTFLDCHTSEEIAFGSYNKQGDFELLSFRDGTTKTFVSAAVAYLDVQKQLTQEYGY